MPSMDPEAPPAIATMSSIPVASTWTSLLALTCAALPINAFVCESMKVRSAAPGRKDARRGGSGNTHMVRVGARRDGPRLFRPCAGGVRVNRHPVRDERARAVAYHTCRAGEPALPDGAAEAGAEGLDIVLRDGGHAEPRNRPGLRRCRALPGEGRIVHHRIDCREINQHEVENDVENRVQVETECPDLAELAGIIFGANRESAVVDVDGGRNTFRGHTRGGTPSHDICAGEESLGYFVDGGHHESEAPTPTPSAVLIVPALMSISVASAADTTTFPPAWIVAPASTKAWVEILAQEKAARQEEQAHFHRADRLPGADCRHHPVVRPFAGTRLATDRTLQLPRWYNPVRLWAVSGGHRDTCGRCEVSFVSFVL